MVEQALDSLRAKELTRRVKSTGQRVIKYRHVVEEALSLDRPESTLLGVLLLRGAQTPGELKQRTERWHSFRSLADVEDALARLTDAEIRAAARAPARPEGSALDPAPRSGRRRRPRPTAGPGRTRVGAGREHRAPAAAPEPVVAREPEPIAQPHSLEVRNPATGEIVRSVAITETGEIAQKITRARAAQPAWAARPYAERAATLRSVPRAVGDRRPRSARDSRPARWASRSASRATRSARCSNASTGTSSTSATSSRRASSRRTDALEERITYEPVGVVAHVSAWNYPYFVGLNSIVPALLAGNAVCYKPSEHATLTGLRHRRPACTGRVCRSTSCTRSSGAGPTGAALVEADVDMVCFTGSYATGRRVARGRRRPPDPRAARARRQGRRLRVRRRRRRRRRVRDRRGRVLQRRPVVQRDRARLRARGDLGRVRGALGRGGRRRTVSAIPTTTRPTSVRSRAPSRSIVLETQLADAVAARRQGGVRRRSHRPARQLVRADGRRRRSRRCRPHARRELRSGDRCARGCATTPKRSATDGRHRVRSRRVGVHDRSRPRPSACSARLDVGNAYWNTADRSCVRLPWSGRRHSGLGTSMSESGVRAFVREKAWHLFP